MAAMAQTDCGQCGYLCQSYAEAIARGEEKSLSRCAPGGKATARKLKELVATIGAGHHPAVVSAQMPKPTPLRAPQEPFDTIFILRSSPAQSPGIR